jgi:hypothetical protein
MSRVVENVGIGALYGSFLIHQNGGVCDLKETDRGLGVTLSGNNEISLGNDGEPFLGILVSVSGDLGVVQLAGVSRVGYPEAGVPALGDQIVVDGTGLVHTATPGRGLVLSVDPVGETLELLY